MVGSTAGDDSLTYRQWLPRVEATIVCMFIVVIILFIAFLASDQNRRIW